MDVSSLERIASSLESSLDSWGFCLAVATLLVVIGLVLEYWHEVRRLLAERPFRWRAFQELMGAVLVTVGVAGELLIQAQSSKVESGLRDVNHKIEASLNKEAADARQLAEAERLARVKLEEEIQPRYLSEEQQREASDDLRRLAGRNLLIGSHWNDVESARLARQIKAMLNNAGIGIGRNSPEDLIGKYPQIPVGQFGGGTVSGVEIHTGVEVWGVDKEVVGGALRSIGKLTVSTPSGPSPFRFDTPELITILVGVKPIPGTK